MYLFCAMRIYTLLLIGMFACAKAFAGIDVELEVVFRDSVPQCCYLYVLSPNAGTNDTLAVFDTLSFDGRSRISLFYTAAAGSNQFLSLVNPDGQHRQSRMFKVLPQRTGFVVMVGQRRINIINTDYLYPRKNGDERSYFVFLLFFFAVKFCIVVAFVFTAQLPRRNIAISSGAFLLSAFIDWMLPIPYLYRFLMMVLAEYLLIALVGRRSVSWFRAALLVLVVNMVGFGLITSLYLWFVFW
jgi:hypothetical protein